MIQYYTYLTKDEDCCVYRSINDKKKYRFLKLENGLKVIIIQDVRKANGGDQCSEEQAIKRMRLDEGSKTTAPDSSSSQAADSANANGADRLAAVALTLNVGAFTDPSDLQGLSHFIEHVVLMGNKEYPVLNEFENYLCSHSGYVNAHTLAEFVMYEASLPNAYLDGCLVRFAACFKEPLFRPEHIESEIQPVNNEYIDAFTDDDVRFERFVCYLAKNDHPASNFLYGNYKSLLEGRDVNEVRNKMVEFFGKHYKASRMSLVVQSQESLDAVEKLVRQYFKDLPTAPNDQPTPEQLNETELIRDLLSKSNVFARKEYPFAKETLNQLYVIEPIEDTNTLKLIYCFPPLVNLHKLKPLHTLSSILGYEGSNSLIRYLIKKKLVLEFLVSQDETSDLETTQYHSMLSLIIKLTDKGLEQVDLVVRLINYYINLMNREGPQDRHFEEERLISLINIRFEDEPSPARYTQDISRQLFRYPLEYAVVGPKMLCEFNANVVKYCLEFLKSQPRFAFLESKTAFARSSWPAQSEQWSDLQFKVEPLPERWSEPLIEDEELASSLKMPPPNDFIPSNFELRPQECFFDQPMLIDEDDHYRCYFKNDKVFKTPKACIYVAWQSNYLRLSPEMLVSLHLYVKYFCLVIGEHAYPAEMAGLAYSLHASANGLELRVDGFNDRLSKLLKLIVDSLSTLKINETLFDAVKLELIREYYNLMIANEEQVSDLVKYLEAKHHTPYTQQREIAKRLDIETVRTHVELFFNSSYLQCLVQGNYTRQEAHDLFGYVQAQLEVTKETVALAELKKSYVYEQPAGAHYCYVKSFNKQDENILIINNYQLGKLSEEEIVMLELCMHEMSEPLFNLLRNEKTLAYHLYNRHTRSRNDVCSFEIFIKSLANKFTPTYVDEQIEWFIGHFLEENVLKMSEAHFEETREARIKMKQIPFISLRKEANYNWKEIWCLTYQFDRKEREIEILKKLKLSTFVEFAKRILTKTPERRKLSVCSVGTGEKSEQLFTGVEDELNAILDEEDAEEALVNNDEVAYSLIHLQPKQAPADGAKLVANVESFVNERVCY